MLRYRSSIFLFGGMIGFETTLHMGIPTSNSEFPNGTSVMNYFNWKKIDKLDFTQRFTSKDLLG